MNNEFLAHVKQEANDEWLIHPLEEHLREVGRLASKMAKDFNSQDWAKAAGLWHDLGKYRSLFQSYIKNVSGYEQEECAEYGKRKVDHSTAGAVHAIEKVNAAGKLLAYLIAGHHAGLPDWIGGDSGASALENRLQNARKKGYLIEALQANVPKDILGFSFNLSKPLGGSDGLHLWLRMLFSCLVDADFLDTERFMDLEKSENEK